MQNNDSRSGGGPRGGGQAPRSGRGSSGDQGGRGQSRYERSGDGPQRGRRGADRFADSDRAAWRDRPRRDFGGGSLAGSGGERPPSSGGERPTRGGRPAKGAWDGSPKGQGTWRSGGPERDRRPGRPEREPEVERPGRQARADEPATPLEDYDDSMLPMAIRAELKGVSKELSTIVGAHLVAAAESLDEDPQLAYRHAEAARRRAPRLSVVREAAAETAYAAGEYAAALREFRAMRRMTGSTEYTAVIADCERALGKPREAIETLHGVDQEHMSPAQRVELLIVEAGARSDLGQRDEALRLLEAAISARKGPRLAQGRLRFAYAELLLAADNKAAAREWLEAVAKFDPDDELGAATRLAELDA